MTYFHCIPSANAITLKEALRQLTPTIPITTTKATPAPSSTRRTKR